MSTLSADVEGETLKAEGVRGGRRMGRV